MRVIIFCVCLLPGGFPFQALMAAEEPPLVTDMWISEAPPVAKVHAAYLTLVNNSDGGIVLEQIRSADYDRIEIHESVVDGQRASMRHHAELAIPAGSTVEFRPGGYHLMLFSPGRRLQAGNSVNFEFYFSSEIKLSVDASVRKRRLPETHQHH